MEKLNKKTATTVLANNTFKRLMADYPDNHFAARKVTLENFLSYIEKVGVDVDIETTFVAFATTDKLFKYEIAEQASAEKRAEQAAQAERLAALGL